MSMIAEIQNFNSYNLPNQPLNQTSGQSFKNFKPSYNLLQSDLFKPKKEPDNSGKVKIGVLSTSILATLGVLYGISKQKGLNPLKNFNMFRQNIEPMDMLKITGVTVPVSLATGIAHDKKENTIPKVKEGISQMVGNLIIPITLINETLKFKDRIMLKNYNSKIMKKLQKTHKAAYTAVSLVGGLMIGNVVANNINKCLFKEHKTRPLKVKDFTVHFDDVCFATSLIFKGNKLGDYASRIIPATLLLSAYETGTKTRHDK